MANRPTRSMIYKRDRNSCQYCGVTTRLTIDHVIPRSKGGEDTWDNLVVACSSCNVKKSDKMLEQTNLKLRKMPRAPYSTVAIDLAESSVDEWREYSYVQELLCFIVN